MLYCGRELEPSYSARYLLHKHQPLEIDYFKNKNNFFVSGVVVCAYNSRILGVELGELEFPGL